MHPHRRSPREFNSLNAAELIHELNQRYRREWDRAERLRAELESIKASRAWRALVWLRRLRGWLGKSSPPPARPEASLPRFLEDHRVFPAGRVSIVIPFKDRASLLKNCLRSLRGGSYPRYEIVLVDNGSVEAATFRFLDRLRGRRRVRVVEDPGPFNFARLCNLGARVSRGDFLVFLNNDTQVLASDWLEAMLELAGHPEIGIVGATLLYPDKTLQHAGIFPLGASWAHLHRGQPEDYSGENGELLRPRTVPAVTAACLMASRIVFEELGGFSESFPVAMNDVDLCQRARQRGWLVGISPHAKLTHFESLSRGYSLEV